MTALLETAIQEAGAACLKHAKAQRYRDVSDVATAMGLKNDWVLFKWAQTGRFPAVVIPEFERACGATLLSKCLAESAGLLAIPAPTPEPLAPCSWAQVNSTVAQAMAQAAIAVNAADQQVPAIKAINKAMDALATMRHQLAQDGAGHGNA